MDFLSKFYFNYSKLIKTIKIYLLLAGPGMIVMIADNDAGGITTYAATGAKFGYSLIWFLILLGPVAYFVQEMTVRLGAVTKHGHAEAIFSAFGLVLGLVFPSRPDARQLADDGHRVYRYDGSAENFSVYLPLITVIGRHSFNARDCHVRTVLDLGKDHNGLLPRST